MNSADELSEWLGLWGSVHAHKKERGKGREAWVVNFYYPLGDDRGSQVFSANSFELFLALQTIISMLREFWDDEKNDSALPKESMIPGALLPTDTEGRLLWLHQAGSVSVTRANHVYDRNSPWLVKVVIAAMSESWVEKEGRDIHKVLGEAIEGVREFWANFGKEKTDESSSPV